jgi:hypothetical protein
LQLVLRPESQVGLYKIPKIFEPIDPVAERTAERGFDLGGPSGWRILPAGKMCLQPVQH